MGARLSLLAPSAPTIAISSYIDILKDIHYVELVSNSRFLKTIKAIDAATGNIIIVKVLIKPSDSTGNYTLKLGGIIEQLSKESSLLAQFNNVLPWCKIIETDRAGYLIRQWIRTNLYDRLSLKPFLEPIERLFFVFQILKIVENLHEKLTLYHGELKLENFLVTSWNWLMLTDFSEHIKPLYLPEDNPNQYSFYFDNSGRRLCYIAPERFYDSKGNTKFFTPKQEAEAKKNTEFTRRIDLFSMGCVIVELFSDGEPTFTLSQLFKYMKGEFTPDLSLISNHHIKEFVKDLISLDPSKRPLASTILKDYKEKCFPVFFYDFLYEFMSGLNDIDMIPSDENVTLSDLKLQRIYESFDSISKALHIEYNYDDTPDIPNELSVMKIKLKGMEREYLIKPSHQIPTFGESHESPVIILNLIFSLMRSLKVPTSKIKGCELILALSERINDDCKLDRSLPYLCQLIDEYIESCSSLQSTFDVNFSSINSDGPASSAKVVSIALRSIATLLSTCSSISPINSSIFTEYLLPKLQLLMGSNAAEEEKRLIKITIASILPSLAMSSKRFWLMAKTFKSDVLKNYNTRYSSQSFYDRGDRENADLYNGLVVSKEQLVSDFKVISSAVLTDPDSNVKMALVNNISELSWFFGVDMTNSFILPHLITYLNDPSYELRLAFLDSVLNIGHFIGPLSFEQYLLPLLIQTLMDSEQLVIIKVLQIFYNFVEGRLINPKIEFNSLAIYKELLENSICFIVHPNEWVRQSVVNLMLAISNNLSYADRYCFMYPIIKSYLLHDISQLTWETLYPCLVQPLSKNSFDLAVSWCTSSTSRSLFWSKADFRSQFNKSSAVDKNLGKSVYINNVKDVFTISEGQKFTLSPEDRSWYLKLKSVGLEEKDFWKVAVLRDYIFSLSKHHSTSNQKDLTPNTIELATKPRNIFYELAYKTESISMDLKANSSNTESFQVDLDTMNRKNGSHKSLILPSIRKANVSLQTSQTNVFGELDHSHEYLIDGYKPGHGSKNLSENNATHKVFSINEQKITTVETKHNYTGNNPFIINYLANVNFEPTIDDFSEFGRPVESKHSMNSNFDSESFKPSGFYIAGVDLNRDLQRIDSITSLAVSPNGEFFVTGSESGVLSAWDGTKLEKQVPIKNPCLSLNMHSSITVIHFIPGRNVFCVATRNGQLKLYKVKITRGKNRQVSKLSKLELVRGYNLNIFEDGYVTGVEFCITQSKSWLAASTSNSSIILFDILKMKIDFKITNPATLGIINTFVVYPNEYWLLLGTSEGILSLWDLRFKLMVRTLKVKSNDEQSKLPIKRLLMLPNDFLKSHDSSRYFAMICDGKNPDITVWEIPNFECREIYSTHQGNPVIKLYTLEKVTASNIDLITEATENLKLDLFHSENDRGMVNFLYIECNGKNYFIAPTWDKRLIVWDISRMTDSFSLGGSDSSFNTSKLSSKLNFNYEKTSTSKSENTYANFREGGSYPEVILDLDFLKGSTPMFIAVDRRGTIRLYS
ncbi:Piso0_002333 [Millerozyma farinosa CBS 7064]|uniref:non-specific serine/threonine protein kinase n=1 Tax=Pichia sorbitophila (strain ATCC MYA-4447 / BCRC 22081 / CBS 7064 / NBRC 10061 / NRRL Y-12695) TaxID=559304 RepID=G8YES1_PICSO|nr:Piso0_002333 [Millerozyma farinosa CBS 7064]